MSVYKYTTIFKFILLLMGIKIYLSFLVEKQSCDEHICICLYTYLNISLEYTLEMELLVHWLLLVHLHF